MNFIERAMQFWLFLFGAVACVALSGAAPDPAGEEKEISEELLDRHDINKCELIVNAVSDTVHGI